MVIAAELVSEYGDSLCFKGGFVLRHVHDHERFSKDIDATRINPPKNKLDAMSFASTIRRAGMRNLLTLEPGEPGTDSKAGLDFDSVAYRGPTGDGQVSVEVSYREAVIAAPCQVSIGPPYFKPFACPVMQIEEIVAEKLRTLVQRTRPTDLADLAMILERHALEDEQVRALTAKKFELVKQGDKQRRIMGNLTSMASEYDSTIRDVAPDAPGFAEASDLLVSRLRSLLP